MEASLTNCPSIVPSTATPATHIKTPTPPHNTVPWLIAKFSHSPLLLMKPHLGYNQAVSKEACLSELPQKGPGAGTLVGCRANAPLPTHLPTLV